MDYKGLETIRTIALLSGLSIMSIEDIKKREVRSLWFILMGAVGLLILIAMEEVGTMDTLFRFVPGVICLLLAWMTRQQIGYGDALLILVLGLYLQTVVLLNVCLVTLMLAGMVSLLLLTCARKSKTFELPLVPFVLAGYVLVWWLA